jgi:diaminopimelate epimerase
MVPFAKAHGLGNDFLLVPSDRVGERDPRALAKSICDRRTGVGADGLILWSRLEDGFRLRIINSDGSDAESSGNGLRSLAVYLFDSGNAGGDVVRLQTVSGIYTIEKLGARGPLGPLFRADMGRPTLEPSKIPFSPGVPVPDRIVDFPLDVDGTTVRISACATGNPHCSVFVDELDPRRIATLGPRLESHPAFPNRTNVEFVHVLDRGNIEVRFWERGAGPTPASGTGSCGATVASILNGRTDRKVVVHAEKGQLEVEWTAEDRLSLIASASVIAEGHYVAAENDSTRPEP